MWSAARSVGSDVSRRRVGRRAFVTANPMTSDAASPPTKDAWVSVDEVPILLGVVAVDAFVVYAVTWWLPWFRWSEEAVAHRETLWSVLERTTPVIATSVAVVLLFLDRAIAASDSARRRWLFLAACSVIAVVSGWYGWGLANGFDGAERISA